MNGNMSGTQGLDGYVSITLGTGITTVAAATSPQHRIAWCHDAAAHVNCSAPGAALRLPKFCVDIHTTPATNTAAVNC
jgi:hypothetical protein